MAIMIEYKDMAKMEGLANKAGKISRLFHCKQLWVFQDLSSWLFLCGVGKSPIVGWCLIWTFTNPCFNFIPFPAHQPFSIKFSEAPTKRPSQEHLQPSKASSGTWEYASGKHIAGFWALEKMVSRLTAELGGRTGRSQDVFSAENEHCEEFQQEKNMHDLNSVGDSRSDHVCSFL